MGVHLRSDCWCSLRELFLRVSLRFGCFEDNEGGGVAPSTSQAAFACGGVRGSSTHGGRRPQYLFARTSRLETTMRAVGIEKRELEVVQIILRQLPERYDVVKTTTLADPQLTRSRLETTIHSDYSQHKAHEIAKRGPAAGAPAEPPNPHALVVGRGFGDEGGGRDGGQRRDDGMVLHGGGMLRQQQQQQQHWSRGGGMPRKQQQQQHWSRGGGMPRQQQQQQQWSRGEVIPQQHQRSSHAFPPARQVRQQQPQQQPSRRIPTIGVGGIYDCGRGAVYFQENSPPPPGAPMCAVYRCGHCGKHGFKSEHCTAPHRLRVLAAPAASMVTYGGTVLLVAVGNFI